MKKAFALISLFSVMTASSASARVLNLDGSITLHDGGRVVRINVGGEDRQDSRSMIRRIKRLEEAVRALQNRVYDLEDTQVLQVEKWTCKIVRNSFGDTYYGDTEPSRGEAERSAHQRCLSEESFASRCSPRTTTIICTND